LIRQGLIAGQYLSERPVDTCCHNNFSLTKGLTSASSKIATKRVGTTGGLMTDMPLAMLDQRSIEKDRVCKVIEKKQICVKK
jgi:hypothetical protein